MPEAARPGEHEFLGCNKYPADKKFRWGVRGEVGVPELVASLGEISCRPIVVGPAVTARAGKLTLEVPDLLTTTEVYRLFYSALEAIGLTVEESGRTLKIIDAGRAREVRRAQLEAPRSRAINSSSGSITSSAPAWPDLAEAHRAHEVEGGRGRALRRRRLHHHHRPRHQRAAHGGRWRARSTWRHPASASSR